MERHGQYIAQKLLEINERRTYTNPDDVPLEDPQRVKKLAEQDEDIFQTARLINCSWFASAIFSDYFHSILGLVRQGTSWTLTSFGVSGPLSLFYFILADDTLPGIPRCGSQALRTWSWKCV